MNALMNHMAVIGSTRRIHLFPTKQRIQEILSCRPWLTFALACVGLPICALLAVALATFAVMLPVSLFMGWL